MPDVFMKNATLPDVLVRTSARAMAQHERHEDGWVRASEEEVAAWRAAQAPARGADTGAAAQDSADPVENDATDAPAEPVTDEPASEPDEPKE